MTPALTAMSVLILFSACAFLGYLFTGLSRGYLLYLGAGFLICAGSIFTPRAFCWITNLLALAVFTCALVAGINDTRMRLREFRAEQREREAAFGEFLQTTTRTPEKRPVEKSAERANG